MSLSKSDQTQLRKLGVPMDVPAVPLGLPMADIATLEALSDRGWHGATIIVATNGSGGPPELHVMHMEKRVLRIPLADLNDCINALRQVRLHQAEG